MLPAFMMLASLPPARRCCWRSCSPASWRCSCSGWVFKRGIVDPLLATGMMPIVVATIGLSIAMRNGVRAGYSAEAHPFPRPVRRQAVQHRPASRDHAGRHRHLGRWRSALVLGTQAFLARTVTGRAMQAVAQNTESATVLGINVPRMIFYTFAINAVLAVRRGTAGHADLSRQVRHGRVAGHQGLLRRHHRRLQQLARRVARRR